MPLYTLQLKSVILVSCFEVLSPPHLIRICRLSLHETQRLQTGARYPAARSLRPERPALLPGGHPHGPRGASAGVPQTRRSQHGHRALYGAASPLRGCRVARGLCSAGGTSRAHPGAGSARRSDAR